MPSMKKNEAKRNPKLATSYAEKVASGGKETPSKESVKTPALLAAEKATASSEKDKAAAISAASPARTEEFELKVSKSEKKKEARLLKAEEKRLLAEDDLYREKLKADAEQLEKEAHLATLSQPEYKAARMKDIAEKQVEQSLGHKAFKSALEERLKESEKSALLLENERLEKEGQDRLREARLEKLKSNTSTLPRKGDRKAKAQDQTPTQKVSADKIGEDVQKDEEVDYDEEKEDGEEETDASELSESSSSLDAEDKKSLEDLTSGISFGEETEKEKLPPNPFTSDENEPYDNQHPVFSREWMEALQKLGKSTSDQAQLMVKTFSQMSKGE
jgi:hypothetical protein